MSGRKQTRKNLRSREKPKGAMGPSSINGGSEVVLYEAPDGGVQLGVRLERETVWLTQAQMAELFGRERSVITKHVRSVFKEGELDSNSVRASFAHAAILHMLPRTAKPTSRVSIEIAE